MVIKVTSHFIRYCNVVKFRSNYSFRTAGLKEEFGVATFTLYATLPLKERVRHVRAKKNSLTTKWRP